MWENAFKSKVGVTMTTQCRFFCRQVNPVNSLTSNLQGMSDIGSGLTILSFEAELTVNEKKLLYLRARYAGLTFCGCAHAVFLCKLVHSLKCIIKRRTAAKELYASKGHGELSVGILGLGTLGKQLLLCLLKKTTIRPTQIKVSTRNPAEECVPPGVECFFDNRCLAAWADILFLCCLPSHLDRICADLHSHLQKHCLVYSFITAVPVNRLAQRLGHSFVLKPQYQVEACDTSDLWLSYSRVTEALSDLSLIEASCPLAMKGGITLGLKWVCGVLYSLLNICTNVCMGSSEALSLINSMFAENSMNNEPLKVESFIASPSFLHPNKSFPWISLVDVQTKETPLLHFVMNSKPVQENIWTTYKSNLKSTIK
ncbi:PREDICTED: NADP-dependent oxidoreductase domain-containing protein 1 [Poecilia mexicana]|uniref:NADP-dependent oxidoreductase domain-containing protein 1 n=1 Tax=Poecilia mexicana TaxID=48701 RepID=UPI00072E9655|nr:PREDICTED: NADP-dependent oxidoreductase domain-containing protein 1 [Poecilia mexicana]